MVREVWAGGASCVALSEEVGTGETNTKKAKDNKRKIMGISGTREDEEMGWHQEA